MDTLQINALTVATQIGVHPWEQRIRQNLSIDIIIPYDTANCNDTLEHTIDYDALCQRVTTFVESKSFHLIETVANEVALLIKQEFPVETLTVSVSKPHAIKNAGPVRVNIER